MVYYIGRREEGKGYAYRRAGGGGGGGLPYSLGVKKREGRAAIFFYIISTHRRVCQPIRIPKTCTEILVLLCTINRASIYNSNNAGREMLSITGMKHQIAGFSKSHTDKPSLLLLLSPISRVFFSLLYTVSFVTSLCYIVQNNTQLVVTPLSICMYQPPPLIRKLELWLHWAAIWVVFLEANKNFTRAIAPRPQSPNLRCCCSCCGGLNIYIL